MRERTKRKGISFAPVFISRYFVRFSNRVTYTYISYTYISFMEVYRIFHEDSTKYIGAKALAIPTSFVDSSCTDVIFVTTIVPNCIYWIRLFPATHLRLLDYYLTIIGTREDIFYNIVLTCIIKLLMR